MSIRVVISDHVDRAYQAELGAEIRWVRVSGHKDKTLVVDLDGTLLDSDFLVESAFAYVRSHPLGVFNLLIWLLRGKAHLKSRLVEVTEIDIAVLPYNQKLLEWLRQRRADGWRLVLATATHERHAQAMASHLDIFDHVHGTRADRNLSGDAKRDMLATEYGSAQFEYVGNAKADFPIWRVASRAHIVNPERGVLAKARKLSNFGELFQTRPGYVKSLVKALRPHQWLKNLLLFVPLAASHKMAEASLLWDGLIAFISFGACASSVYVLNDLLDLQDDRKHRSKRFRPLASGALPIKHGVILAPVLLAVAVGLAWWLLPLPFLLVLLGYYVVTLAYSLWLKRLALIDVVTLALLYTVRIIAGVAAFQMVVTFWIITFSLFVFLSLALVKRYTELHGARLKDTQEKTLGRGYYPGDFELLASLGGGAGYVSVLVLALYVNEAAATGLYRHPQLLWLACPLLLFWISRVWLLAHRGAMHDDPIVFAIKDATSRWVGVLFVGSFLLAA